MAEPAGEPGATRSDRDWLVDYLADREVLCPNCHYNLRGLTGTTCPECGLGLALRVNLVEPRLAAWLVGLIGLATGLGWAGSVTLFGLIVLAMGDPPPKPFQTFALFGFELVVSVVLLTIWLRGRSWMRVKPRMSRFFLAALCWLPTPIMVVLPRFLFG
ncbi:MAG: hypothetical protein AAF586_07960 [Planctomycetota bacterium]